MIARLSYIYCILKRPTFLSIPFMNKTFSYKLLNKLCRSGGWEGVLAPKFGQNLDLILKRGKSRVSDSDLSVLNGSGSDLNTRTQIRHFQ